MRITDGMGGRVEEVEFIDVEDLPEACSAIAIWRFASGVKATAMGYLGRAFRALQTSIFVP